MDLDFQLALLLQKELNDQEPIVIKESPQKRNDNHPSKSRGKSSLVDPELEFIDPTPDIHALFFQFNDRFFWGKLNAVEVKWSPRMTSCAGVCVYQGRAGFCSVRLSLPLLKLRPRKDLVETLLHEMIHAFLFVTKNNRDRDGHGPEFHKHMNRINQEAGTHISVYHSFHDEVRLYQQHWWRCNGPCQHKPPFFGMVRRAMNRAPGPTDNWWAQHEASCGGHFVKVKEPENTKKKATSVKPTNVKGDIRSFFPNSGSLSKPTGGPAAITNIPRASTSSANSMNNLPRPGGIDFKSKTDKIPVNSGGVGQSQSSKGTTSNNVHGFWNVNNSAASTSVKPVENPSVNNVFGFRDLNNQGIKKPTTDKKPNDKGHVLGGSNAGRGSSSYPKGVAGGWNGMLSNKGGGTLVVTGKANDAKRSNPTFPDKQAADQNPGIKVFSGTGHVLGKGNPKDNLHKSLSTGPHSSVKNISVFSNNDARASATSDSMKRVSPSTSEDPKPKKTFLDNVPGNKERHSSPSTSSKVPCPVCNALVLSEIINSHLDECISKPSQSVSVSAPEEVIILSDSDSEGPIPIKSLDPPDSGNCVDCPSCNKPILKSKMTSHLSNCLDDSFQEEEFVPDKSSEESSHAKCPICGESFLAKEMDQHIDNCASCSIQDLSQVFEEDFSDEEEDAAVGSPSQRFTESGESLYPCPCCLILIESSKMNEHLDQCVV